MGVVGGGGGVVFFFQAEDGIRDIGVTGVQTCALPICEKGEIRMSQTKYIEKILCRFKMENCKPRLSP